MLWLFVKKVEEGQQLDFNKFDERFHDIMFYTTQFGAMMHRG
jgi:hypothetical protein